MSVIKGRLEISRGWICFWDAGLGCETADRERADFKFALNQLQEVHLRRYNLRRSALEFFLIDHTTYFVNFNTKVRTPFIFPPIPLVHFNELLDEPVPPSFLLRLATEFTAGFLVCALLTCSTTAVDLQLMFFALLD